MAAVEQYFSSVVFLLHCDGADNSTTFTDHSPSPKVITRGGAAIIDTAQSKFGGASARLDGNGDHIQMPYSAAVAVPTGDFTIEFWVRLFVTPGDAALARHGTSAVNSFPWAFDFVEATRTFRFSGWRASNAASYSISSLAAVNDQQWYHLAGVRSGDTMLFFVDGVLQGTAAVSGSLFVTTATMHIGAVGSSAPFLNGWVDDYRATKGVARYTTDFTPHTVAHPNANDSIGSIAAPPAFGDVLALGVTLVSGSITAPSPLADPSLYGERRLIVERFFQAVSLLLHFDGSDASTTVTDHSSFAHTPTVGGNAQIDTDQSKFGGASGLFDGTGDYVTFPHHECFDFSTSDFTIECWVRFSALTQNMDIVRKSSSASVWKLGWVLSGGQFNFFGAASGGGTLFSISSSGLSIVTGQWYHIAGTRSFTTYRLFVDGALAASTTISGNMNTDANPVIIGSGTTSLVGTSGWIDDVRITKGVARYTAAFTPHTEAHPNSNDMLGLLRAPAVFGDIEMTGGAAIGGYLRDSGLPAGPSIYGGIANRGVIAAPAVLGGVLGARLRGILIGGWLTAPSVFGTVYAKATHDFVDAVEGLPTNYNLDLVTPTGNVRVPMTSWQATLQVENQCYARCTVPGADAWLDTLEEATSFIIYRSAQLPSGAVIEAEIVTAPLDTLQIDRGPINNTASLSGYFPAYEEDDDPDPQFDRVLTGIRSSSSYESGVRVRSEIDWTLRPAQRAFYGEASFIVSYMNLYATCYKDYADAYMDVGERL